MSRLSVLQVALLVLLLRGCVRQGSDFHHDSGGSESTDSFVGAVDQSEALIAFDVSHGARGDRARVFLTDGTPDGDSEYFEGVVREGTMTLASKNGQARITAQVAGDGAAGAVTLADGTVHSFSALPATDGAGLYEVVIDADGGWSGTALNGARVDGELFGKFALGAITDASGRQIPYELRDLSRIFEEPALGNASDSYLIIVLPQGDAMLGRGGADNLKTGQANASANFVRLDLTGSESTSGTFFGRFQDLPDLIGAQFTEMDSEGHRYVSILVSDGRPAPDGRTEWFSGDFAGDFPDASFTLDSAGGDARISNLELKTPPLGTNKGLRQERHNCLCANPKCPACGASGDLQLADGTIHKFYLVPAGDGAGLYEVHLSADGMSGTSETGGRLHLHVDQGQVTGTLISPTGIAFAYSGRDLANTFAHPETLGSAPDTFVVLVTPGGRFIVGSPGTLEGPVELADVAVQIGPLPLQ